MPPRNSRGMERGARHHLGGTCAAPRGMDAVLVLEPGTRVLRPPRRLHLDLRVPNRRGATFALSPGRSGGRGTRPGGGASPGAGGVPKIWDNADRGTWPFHGNIPVKKDMKRPLDGATARLVMAVKEALYGGLPLSGAP